MSVRMYQFDGLASVHNHDFLEDPGFIAAYRRGAQAAGGTDYYWYWRVHIGLWAASHARRLPGDFVECGTNAGFLASAIMQRLDWDSVGKQFYLLDTFSGLDKRFVSDREREAGALDRNREHLEQGFYVTDVESVRQNFSQWRNHRIVVGPVPDTLPQVTAEHIAFLHLDMNCAEPEVAALRHFWDRISTGGVVLLDDYGYVGYGAQKVAMDRLAPELGVPIATLPTGQGLILKP